MSSPYVGVAPTPIDISALKALVDRCTDGDSWLFLRWPHQVKLLPMTGKIEEKDLVCQEGQVFGQSKELRWKRRGNAYEVLLLSEDGGDEALSPIGQDWETKDLEARFYPETETRFPRSIEAPNELDVGQRYFIDAQTACVQFIALRVKHGS